MAMIRAQMQKNQDLLVYLLRNGALDPIPAAIAST